MTGSDFQGRVVIAGAVEAQALVSRQGYNPLASFFPVLIKPADSAVCGDRHNVDTYERTVTGTILCTPTTVGSTSSGSTWEFVARHQLGPAAVLFSQRIDPLAAAGLSVAATWTGHPIIVIDELGERFLSSVRTGNRVRVDDSGNVSVFEC